jgi:hypothetical protein
VRAGGLLDQKLHRGFRGACRLTDATSPTSPMCRPISAGAGRAGRVNITDEQLREVESIQAQLEVAYAATTTSARSGSTTSSTAPSMSPPTRRSSRS